MWAEAGLSPNNNVIGQNPLLQDPGNGNYQPQEGSDAIAYGCQTFSNKNTVSNKKYLSKNKLSFLKKENISLEEVGGNISENTFWNADTIHVISDISIENGINLSIASGTKVLFSNNSKINVLGSISAFGLPDSRINFTGFHSNDSFETWSGIIFNNTLATNDSSFFQYCDFSRVNISDDRIGGVFEFNNFSKANFYGCLFKNNNANYGTTFGLSNYSSPIISNSIFFNNTALFGGSVFLIADSYPNIINNTIVQNTVNNPGTNTETAAIHTYISKPFIENNIIRENIDNYYQDFEITEAKPYYINNNNIDQEFPNGENINADPMFITDANCLYSLQENSPCIDAGNNDNFYHEEDLDFIGNERIVDGNSDGTSKIDMGAYEFIPNISASENVNCEKTSQINIYPNPFFLRNSKGANKINIQYFSKNTSSGILEIFNIKGEMLRKERIIIQKEANIFSWNCKSNRGQKISSGVYFLKITQNKKSFIKKFLLLK